MKLHDSPTKSSTEENDEMSKLPPAQRKKLRQKQKKAEARAKRVISAHIGSMFTQFSDFVPIFLQEAEEKQEDETASSSSSKSGKKQHARPVDLDPHGEKLIQVFMCTAWPCIFV